MSYPEVRYRGERGEISASEGYFQALAAKAAGQQFADDEWTKLCMDHDNYFI
jgi:hypothetical protein